VAVSAALEPFARGLFEALSPLEGLLRQPLRLGLCLRQLGFGVSFETGALEALGQPLRSLADRAANAHADGAAALESLQTAKNPLDVAAAVVDLLAAGQELASVARDLGDALEGADLSQLPGELGVRATWTGTIAPALAEYLLVSWLEGQRPALHAVLRTCGVIPDAAPPRLDLNQLGALLSDPAGTLKARFGWPPGSAGWDADRVLELFADLVGASGFPTRIAPVHEVFRDRHFGGAEPSVKQVELPLAQGFTNTGFAMAGLVVLPVPDRPSGPIKSLLVSSLVEGKTQSSIYLDEARAWALTLDAELSATGAVGVKVGPSGVVADSGTPSAAAGLALHFAPSEESVLFGAAGGSRVVVQGFEIAVEMSTSDLVLRARTVHEGAPGLSLVFSPGESDAFLQGILGDQELKADLDLEAVWSAARGFTFGGQGGLSLEVGLGLEIGPVTIEVLELSALPEPGGARFEGRAAVFGALGPFALEVDGLGLGLSVARAAPGEGNVGPFQVTAGLLAPEGLGFSLDLPPAVSGGGYLFFEPDEGRYGGALQLQVLSIGVTAVGVLTLPPPGSRDSWSLLFVLTLEFPGIPLGFGFSLTGLGGLIGIHRTFDADALTEGVRTGALDELMFPPIPLQDVSGLIEQMEGYFPPAPGSFVVGPLVKISWGVAEMLSAEIGVIISIPDGDVAVMGVFSAALPSPQAPLLELHMAVLGVIDTSEGTLSVVAALYDSRLLQTIELSGEMAMYGRFTSSPYFLLSVGGFNPAFKPPAGVPSSLTSLNQVSASIPLGPGFEVSLGGYFAVTSNTFQIGGRLDLEASAKFLGVTYTADGYLEFHVLLQFNPFRIIADAGAGVTVHANDKELWGIDLAVHVEGPKPWFGTASGDFRFFGIPVKFQITVGSLAGADPPDRFPLESAVRAGLTDPASWRAFGGAGVAASWPLFVLTDPEASEGEELRVRPDGRLEVRQEVAPLNRDIEIVGTAVPEGASLLDLSEAGFVVKSARAAEPTSTVLSNFAPAQFFEMNKAEKLSSPSFEPMDAGVSFGAEGVSIKPKQATEVEATWETAVVGESRFTGRFESQVLADADVRLIATAGQLTTRYNVVSPSVAVSATQYTLVNTVSGLEATQALDQAGVRERALSCSQARAIASELGDSNLAVAPSYALVLP
jgi:hypothetical protein